MPPRGLAPMPLAMGCPWAWVDTPATWRSTTAGTTRWGSTAGGGGTGGPRALCSLGAPAGGGGTRRPRGDLRPPTRPDGGPRRGWRLRGDLGPFALGASVLAVDRPVVRVLWDHRTPWRVGDLRPGAGPYGDVRG